MTTSADLIPGIEALVADHATSLESARAAVDAGRRDVETADAALARAESDYATAGGDGAAVHAASGNLRLAQVRLASAEKRFAEADEAHRGATKALELRLLEHRKTQLLVAASADTYDKESAPHVSRWLAALEELLEAGEAIDAAYTRSLDAAAELRKLGENVASLDTSHVMLSAVSALAERGRVLDDTHHRLRFALNPAMKRDRAIGPQPGVIVDLFAEAMTARPATAARLAAHKATLARTRSTRTFAEARDKEYADSFAALAPEAPAIAAAPKMWRVAGPNGSIMLTNVDPERDPFRRKVESL